MTLYDLVLYHWNKYYYHHLKSLFQPTTEGSTVFVMQASGSRMFVLSPAPECKRHCHRVSTVLHPGHICK